VSDQGTHLAALVRPFVLVGGRTTSSHPELRWESLIEAVPERAGGAATSEQQALVALASKPVSVAELSAALHLPTQVVTIIVGDLLDAGAVRAHVTDPVEVELSALTRMIARVRAL
jgi:hypothetical protein